MDESTICSKIMRFLINGGFAVDQSFKSYCKILLGAILYFGAMSYTVTMFDMSMWTRRLTHEEIFRVISSLALGSNVISCPFLNGIITRYFPEVKDQTRLVPHRPGLLTIILILASTFVVVNILLMCTNIPASVSKLECGLRILCTLIVSFNSMMVIVIHLFFFGCVTGHFLTVTDVTATKNMTDVLDKYRQLKASLKTALLIFFSTQTIISIFNVFSLIRLIASDQFNAMATIMFVPYVMLMALIPVYQALVAEDCHQHLLSALETNW